MNFVPESEWNPNVERAWPMSVSISLCPRSENRSTKQVLGFHKSCFRKSSRNPRNQKEKTTPHDKSQMNNNIGQHLTCFAKIYAYTHTERCFPSARHHIPTPGGNTNLECLRADESGNFPGRAHKPIYGFLKLAPPKNLSLNEMIF